MRAIDSAGSRGRKNVFFLFCFFFVLMGLEVKKEILDWNLGGAHPQSISFVVGGDISPPAKPRSGQFEWKLKDI